MSYTAEPFVVPIQEGVLRPLRAAGFTDAAYKECLAHAVADYAPWQHRGWCCRSIRCARRRGRQGDQDSPKA